MSNPDTYSSYFENIFFQVILILPFTITGEPTLSGGDCFLKILMWKASLLYDIKSIMESPDKG